MLISGLIEFLFIAIRQFVFVVAFSTIGFSIQSKNVCIFVAWSNEIENMPQFALTTPFSLEAKKNFNFFVFAFLRLVCAEILHEREQQQLKQQFSEFNNTQKVFGVKFFCKLKWMWAQHSNSNKKTTNIFIHIFWLLICLVCRKMPKCQH